MKWKAPSERVQFIIAAPIAVPVALAAAVVLLPVAGLIWLEEQWAKRQRAKGRHVWYAWRPVKFDAFWYNDMDSCWFWLEPVDRRWSRGRWEYLPLGFDDPYEMMQAQS